MLQSSFFRTRPANNRHAVEARVEPRFFIFGEILGSNPGPHPSEANVLIGVPSRHLNYPWELF